MKKIYSYTKTMAMAALTLLTAAACDEAYEYAPDNESGSKTGQVYFAPTLPSTIELSSENSEFEIVLNRLNTEGDITIALDATQPEPAIYNVPESVTFADGVAEATIKITVNPENLEFDDMRELTINIEDTYTTPYGNSSYTVKVGVPAPWTPWCNNATEFEAAGGMAEWPLGNVGTGTYTFTQYLSGSESGVTVEFRQHKLTGACQFRFVDLVTSIFPAWEEFVMDATWREDLGLYIIRLPKTTTGHENPNYPNDPVFVIDRLSLIESQGTEVPWDRWETLNDELKSWYNPSTGLFNLSVYYGISLGGFGRGIETFQMDGFYVPDYSVSAIYKGIFTGVDGTVSAVGMATLGRDVTDARAIVMPQDKDIEETVLAMISEEASENLPWVAVTESGNFSVSFDPKAMGTENLQILIASVIDGEAVSVSKATFTYYSEENPWVSLGKGLFTDDIMLTSYFNMDAPTYEVEIMEHKDHPGLYRLMNLYTQEVYPYGNALVNELGARMASTGSYLEVNAENPNAIYIDLQSLQCTIDESEGELSFCTYPVYMINAGQLDFETAKTSGLLGKLVDGVIQFPKFSGPEDKFTFQGLAFAGGQAWYACKTDGIKIVLPDAVANEERAAMAKSRLTNRALRRKVQGKSDINVPHIIPAMTRIAPRSFEP